MYNKNQIYDIGELVRMKVILNDYDRGTFIKIIREWTGLTQKEFAKVLGKCERTIQEYEAGTTNYNIQILEKIIKEFNITFIAEKKK